MTPAERVCKAARALDSARLLLNAGDADGACNRAYYAMFEAARAALSHAGAPVEPAVVKTHAGLISAFSLHLVKTGGYLEKLEILFEYKAQCPRGAQCMCEYMSIGAGAATR